MMPDKLHDAFNYIDDDLIEEVDNLRENPPKYKVIPFSRYVSTIIAACALLVIGIFIFVHANSTAPIVAHNAQESSVSETTLIPDSTAPSTSPAKYTDKNGSDSKSNSKSKSSNSNSENSAKISENSATIPNINSTVPNDSSETPTALPENEEYTEQVTENLQASTKPVSNPKNIMGGNNNGSGSKAKGSTQRLPVLTVKILGWNSDGFEADFIDAAEHALNPHEENGIRSAENFRIVFTDAVEMYRESSDGIGEFIEESPTEEEFAAGSEVQLTVARCGYDEETDTFIVYSDVFYGFAK